MTAFVAEGGSKAGGVSVNLNFTFGIFVCVSILLLHKEKICSASDAASIYGTINGLVGGGGCPRQPLIRSLVPRLTHIWVWVRD